MQTPPLIDELLLSSASISSSASPPNVLPVREHRIELNALPPLSLPAFNAEHVLAGKCSNWKIRYLSEANLADVVRICCDAFPLDYPEYWYKQVVQGKFISYGLFHDDQLTSLLVAEVKYGRDCDLEDRGLLCSEDNARVVYILSLAVKREYRRRGIATLLLDFLIRLVYAQRPLPKLIFLHVLAQNYTAIKFYEQNGFQHFATLNSYYQINDVYHDGFTMVCYISDQTAGRSRGAPAYLKAILLSPKQVCSLVSAIILTPFRFVLRFKPPFLRF